MADPNTRQGKRTPVTLKIKFKSETLEQFIERYAVDVSQGGIFIRTKEPLAVGTQMKFEFQLRDASPLIAGEGTVVWTRENDPSRPAIAPGMGVRFDRLADGSQAVLERILAEKAKQAPGRAHTESASKQAMFTDTPTKVAPAPVQDALGLRSRRDSEQTPLPKPMPFHSDADEFDEKAFEEATKVRSLEELAAQTAGLDTNDDALPGDAGTAVMPADELAEHRKAGRPDSSPPATEKADEAPPAARAVPDRDSAPGLPSPPVVEPTRPPRMLDTTPSPRPEPEVAPAAAQAPSESARTKPGVEPAKAASAAKTDTNADSAVPRAVAAEPSLPVAPQRPSSAPIVIGILVAAAAAIGAVWWFVLRDQVVETLADNSEQTTPADTVATEPGSAGSAVAVAQTDTGSGSADPAAGSADPAAGSADAAGSGDGSGSAEPPASDGPTAATVIAASVKKGATVEVLGTDIKGPAPLTAQLATDKIFKVRVTAPGYAPAELEVKGGDKATAKLALKPRVLTITSDPPGADIFIDGVNTRQLTPADVTLTPGQAARARVRVTLRRPGFKQADQIVQASAFKEEHGRMTHAIQATLAAHVRPAGGTQAGTQAPAGGEDDGAGSESAGSDSGSTTTPPTGSDTPAGGTQPPPASGTPTPTPPASDTPTPPASGTPPPPTPPASGTPPQSGTPAPPPPAGGTTSSGTAEPEPSWTK